MRIFIPSGAGAPGFAGIVRCLREIPEVFVVGGDAREGVYGEALSDAFVLMPSSDQAEVYVSEVIRICLEFRIDVVLPITTRELSVLSANKKVIAESTSAEVIVSDLEGLSIANNKGLLYEFAWLHGFRVPAFTVVSDKMGLQTEAEKLGIGYRELCFKPVEGNGSRGFGRIVPSHDFGESWMEQKAGILPMSLDEWMKRMPESWNGLELLLSVYLPGREYSVDLLCDHGTAINCIPRSRDKMIGGISVAGTFVLHESLIAECCRLAELLKLHGPIGMQWKEDEYGDCYLLEINPRLQGTTSALALAGLNIPQKAVEMLGKGGEKSPIARINFVNEGLEFGWGQLFVRYWEESLLFGR